jgi:hypothetical protein
MQGKLPTLRHYSRNIVFSASLLSYCCTFHAVRRYLRYVAESWREGRHLHGTAKTEEVPATRESEF